MGKPLPTEDAIIRAETIASLTRQGRSGREIGILLGLTRRTVVRYRRGQARRAQGSAQAVDDVGMVA